MVHRHFTSNLLKKKSSITSFHPSFSVVQLAKWYASSYPPTFSHSLGKHIALYNRTGFRNKLLRYTLRWHPVDVLAARCSKVLAKWQLCVRTVFDTGYPRAESSKPASVGVCQSLGQDFEKLALALPTTPCTHAQAHSPSLVVHSWTANGLSTCLKLNIPLRLPVPSKNGSTVSSIVSLNHGPENSLFNVSPTGPMPEDPSFWGKRGSRIGCAWLLAVLEASRISKSISLFLCSLKGVFE